MYLIKLIKQMQLVTSSHKLNEYFIQKDFDRQILLDHGVLEFTTFFWKKTSFVDHVKQRRHFKISQRYLSYLLFVDKGRTHAYYNKIRIDCFRGNPFHACLSEVATDRNRPRFHHNRLGLLVCWIGHNYPVPSSPLHTPMSGAHWPNGMK